MSFAVWKQRPPFAFAPADPEQVYQVGDVFVVTDNPARVTQAEVDKLASASLAAIQETNSIETAKRSRAEQLEELERRMSLGAPQGEVIAAIINLLRE